MSGFCTVRTICGGRSKATGSFIILLLLITSGNIKKPGAELNQLRAFFRDSVRLKNKNCQKRVNAYKEINVEKPKPNKAEKKFNPL